jgi:membrane-bound ClpP family serine protease
MLSNPDIALCVVALGLLGIYVEFCRPGRVLPGITGGVLLIIGIASIANANEPIHWPFGLAIISLVTVVTVYLFRIAIRARRNKRHI